MPRIGRRLVPKLPADTAPDRSRRKATGLALERDGHAGLRCAFIPGGVDGEIQLSLSNIGMISHVRSYADRS
jgi:hypothetical protein